MKEIMTLTVNQNKSYIESKRCIHFLAAHILKENYHEIWPDIPNIPDGVQTHNTFIHPEARALPPLKDKPFVAAVQKYGDISILYCVTGAQQKPFCSEHTQKGTCKGWGQKNYVV